jgi:hypothetical protein
MTVTDHSPRRWEEASPGNVAGEARALTAIGPLRHGLRYLKLRAGFIARRYVFFFRARKVANLRRLGFIHFARWVIFDDVPENGGRRPLGHTYMFFESNFNGGFDEYIDAFSYVIKGDMQDIFGSAYNWPGPVPATAFKDFIRRHDYEADHFYSAYPEATATDVRGALQLAQAMESLQAREEEDPFAFAARWRGVLTRAKAFPDPGGGLPSLREVFAGWSGSPDKAISADVYALTILLRVRPGHAQRLRADIHGLGKDDPFAAIDGTHFARLVVIDRLAFEGPVQDAPDVGGELLLFTAVVDGDRWDGYLGRLRSDSLRPVWDACTGSPRGGDEDFVDWMRKHQLKTRAFYWHYNATVPQVRDALTLRGSVLDFALANQYATAPDLYKRFRGEFGGPRP